MVKNEVELGKVHWYLSSNVKGNPSEDVQWYEEEFPLPYEISRQNDISIQDPTVNEETSFTISLSSELEKPLTTMRGFGTSLDGSSIHWLMKMTADDRRAFLTTLIDPINGAGFTQFRLVMGTSDLNAIEQDIYSYYDKIPEGLPNWNDDFSIQNDIDLGVIDVIREIFDIAKKFGIADEINLLASPWSPPGWMKENFENTEPVNNELKLIGGTLKDEHIKDLAIYYRRYLEEYAKLNIHIHSLTFQNEPALVNKTYPSAIQHGYQQAQIAKILRDEIKESAILQEKGYYTELWAWDYGTDTVLVGAVPPSEFFESLETVDPGLTLFDGIAFHAYNYLTLGQIREFSEKYPDKTIHLTEGMEPGTLGLNRIIMQLKENCSSYYHWVTCLDTDGRPNEWLNSPHIKGWKEFGNVALAIYNEDNYWFLPTKNLMGQISRFVRPGCIMTSIKEFVTTDDLGYEMIAYQDTINNNIILVVSNDRSLDLNLEFKTSQEKIFKVTMPAKTAATFIYSINS